jgi:hypothetical protein
MWRRRSNTPAVSLSIRVRVVHASALTAALLGAVRTRRPACRFGQIGVIVGALVFVSASAAAARGQVVAGCARGSGTVVMSQPLDSFAWPLERTGRRNAGYRF